ncbi:MAG: CIA30 family protein [Anaerolineales bacterium]|nr:CIA30 family protein [Anaerolineales bacterium]
MKESRRSIVFSVCGVLFLLVSLLLPMSTASAQSDTPAPPDHTVKLIFIHHSCGENWLTDGHGDLGRTLGENNYFVSDTNYGWGPHSIGDRTDTLDWPEWFLGGQRDQILSSLYNESGQNSSYTRTLENPGGENEIIMFKSCFPNSEIDGSPNDPPSDDDWLTVGSAKRVYNDLLTYFITRPDKLFVVITAPPLQENEYAANARAFNTWLVQDWLEENNYPYSNVAVWDFYNVLTDPDNHHRYVDGGIEYTTNAGGNVLYYPDNGDTHPSPSGNHKATAEFVPMLNYFYQRWQGSAEVVEMVPAPVAQEGTEPQPAAGAQQPASLIESFEGEAPAGSYGWEAYFDPSSETIFNCMLDSSTAYEGLQSLWINYDIGPQSWGTCSLMFPTEQDWSSTDGVSFAVAGDQPESMVNLDIYTGPEEARASYVYRFSFAGNGPENWAVTSITWDQIQRVEWEADDTPFDPARISGIAFGFEGGDADRTQGQLWIDQLSLGSAELTHSAVGPDEESPLEEAEESIGAEVEQRAEALEEGARSLCPLSLGLIVLVGTAALSLWFRRL